MRLFAPLLAIVSVFAVPLATEAAIGIEQNAPTEAQVIERRDYVDRESAHSYEKNRSQRLEAQKRAQIQKRALGIAAIGGPVILIAAAAFIYYRMRHADPHRIMHKKLKQAEARRRAGRPTEQALDPRKS